jgi:hypothetical protein
MTTIILFLHSVLCKMAENEFSSPSTNSRGALLFATIWVYKMGIYSCKTGCTRMYMYDETTGKKNSNESVSLLKHHIRKYI